MIAKKELLVATNNQGKISELLAILAPLELKLLTLREAGIVLDVAETGDSYAQNAALKAQAAAASAGLVTIADDSGLEVDALTGAPGVYSARYAGEGATDAQRRLKLLNEIKTYTAPYPARFCCALAVAAPNHEIKLFEGICAGEIILEERGANGFGYDPIFYLPQYKRTMAELESVVKNQISHRAMATKAACDYLRLITRH